MEEKIIKRKFENQTWYMFDFLLEKNCDEIKWQKCVGISNLNPEFDNQEFLNVVTNDGLFMKIPFNSVDIKNMRKLKCDFLELKQQNDNYIDLEKNINYVS